MSEYIQQAKDFLAKCNATIEINFIGKKEPLWDEGCPHNAYQFIITTPLGAMENTIYDSAYNTARGINGITEYDVLACLEKYDVGTIDDFVSEFGYEVHCWDDVKRIKRTYKAVVEQYNKLCEIFTPEQMEWLREVQ
jgi:hypothetical protein